MGHFQTYHRPCHTYFKNSKEKMPKAYERQEPFEDPIEEKKRLNAIKAKEARERAKVKGLALNEENRKIRKENKKLRKMLAQCKLIMKSHSNIKYPFESS